MNKATYPYNETLRKDNTNNLLKDSIVKCDDLIEIQENEIKFKIGEVTQADLDKFVNTFGNYVDTLNV